MERPPEGSAVVPVSKMRQCAPLATDSSFGKLMLRKKRDSASSLPPLPGLGVAVTRELSGLNNTNSSELSFSMLVARQGKTFFGLASY